MEGVEAPDIQRTVIRNRCRITCGGSNALDATLVWHWKRVPSLVRMACRAVACRVQCAACCSLACSNLHGTCSANKGAKQQGLDELSTPLRPACDLVSSLDKLLRWSLQWHPCRRCIRTIHSQHKTTTHLDFLNEGRYVSLRRTPKLICRR